MCVKSLVRIGVLGWCVIGADSVGAAELRRPVCAVPQVQSVPEGGVPTADKAEPSALHVSIAPLASGGLRLSATAEGIDVQKTVSANGEYSVSLRSGRDVVTVLGNGARIKVARGRRAVGFDLNRPETASYDRASILLAGSPALRAFRAARSRMSPEARESPGGVAMEIIDVLLSVAQGDPNAPDRFRAAESSPLGLMARDANESCFREWRAEVQSAWDEYEACYRDFNWWSGGREACAFMWTIRVEAAWFRMWGCTAFPFSAN
jgi:hypothetical protein